MSGIFWLASYPKSGNTWLRALLTNYLRDAEEPADINELDFGGEGFMRENFDDWLGIDSNDLTSGQISHYRPLIYEQMAAQIEETLFIKVHDAYETNRDGRAIFSEKATRGAIYLVRNPLDVAVSYAHHENELVDRTIRRMGNAEDYGNRSNARNRQNSASWSHHVASWIDAPNLNIHLVRYEELTDFTAKVFSEIVCFAGLSFDERKIEKAIRFSRFEILQKQEMQSGFKEKQPTAESFFRRGKTGGWREVLTQSQVARIIDDHREVMKRFGYLGANDEILC